jgi:hypothetical protein
MTITSRSWRCAVVDPPPPSPSPPPAAHPPIPPAVMGRPHPPARVPPRLASCARHRRSTSPGTRLLQARMAHRRAQPRRARRADAVVPGGPGLLRTHLLSSIRPSAVASSRTASTLACSCLPTPHHMVRSSTGTRVSPTPAPRRSCSTKCPSAG